MGTRPEQMTWRGTRVRATSAAALYVLSFVASGACRAANSDTQPTVEEIVVTARKVTEYLQDVPMSVTALSGEELQKSQQFRLEDFANDVPGLNIIQSGVSTQLIIRGLTSGSGAVNSSVATYIDDTPYTAVGPFAGSTSASPDLDTFDMQRIEVLRGPQGTLYGASALGGLLKYVTNAPDPSKFASTVSAGVNTVSGGGTGFDLHGMVNLPMPGESALRLVGYDNYLAGYLNDPSRGLSDINAARYTGGRASFLTKPTEDFSARLNVIYQNRFWGSSSEKGPAISSDPTRITPLYGPNIFETVINEPAESTSRLYNLTLDGNLGFAHVLSTTSYLDGTWSFQADETPAFGPFFNPQLNADYGYVLQQANTLHAFTEEIRLASPEGKRLDWQAGAFFTHQVAKEFEVVYPTDLGSQQVLSQFPQDLGTFILPLSYRELAVFANADYHITSTFDVSAGARYSKNNQTYHEAATGMLGGGLDYGQPSSASVWTYSFDARWHFSPDSMVYAHVAKGFVPGGPNDIVPGSPLPNSYASSTAQNYEMGIKSTFLDRKLAVDLDVFDVEWKNIQVIAQIGNLQSIANGGAARSQGSEFSIRYSPIRGLTAALNGAYTDAYLTEATPASVGGVVGSRLAFVPLWSGSLRLDYTRPVSEQLALITGLNWRLSSGRESDFSASTARLVDPGFALLDLRGGLQYRDWTVTAYARNVTNRFAYITADVGAPVAPSSIYAPRTLGIVLSADF